MRLALAVYDGVIPRAYIMPLAVAADIVGYFCDTGRVADDSHWRDSKSLSWSLYVD
jgi:hypothetical protein